MLIGDKAKAQLQKEVSPVGQLGRVGGQGGVHLSICKTIKHDLEDKDTSETKLVLIGDKAKAQLQK